MNKIVKLTLILFLVCAVVAGVLGGVNYITKDRIAEQNREKTEKAYRVVLAADSYTDVEFDPSDPVFAHVTAISRADNGAGYVVVTSTSGAQGAITLATGVTTNMKCTGISVISHSETAGLGAVAASATEAGIAFRNQFIGEQSDIALDDFGGNIDALTGATITSKAIVNAVGEAIDAASKLITDETNSREGGAQ